ncbi:MAG: enoyl-CoA hydratase-related protein [Pseudomonadota bacterium]|nr:enoyl-CoA hydratase-related protein [Pseudomonadota bacterium]
MENDLIINSNEGILEIIFNRPERKNAISRIMFEKMLEVLKRSIHNKDLRGIFVSGSGDSFSAGGDVKDMASKIDTSTLQEKTQSLKSLMQVSKILYTSPVPTVAIINGVAAGAGFAISLSCDFRVSTELGKFTTAFSKVGFSGDFGISYFLSKLVGTSKAKELLYFSDILDAKTALNLDIVNFLIDSKEIETFKDSLKKKFVEMPPIAIKYMKKNLTNVDHESLDTCLDQEAHYQMICSETEDHKNAVKAFVNKEKVNFKGK